MNKKESAPHHRSGFSAGFFFGFLLGALVVFLYATEEGQKVRSLFTKKKKEILKDLPSLVSDLEKRGNDFSKKVDSIKKEFEESASRLSQSAQKQIKTSLEKIEAVQSQGQKTVKSLRRRFFVRNGRKLG